MEKPQDSKYHVYLKSALLFLSMYGYRLNKITVRGKLNSFSGTLSFRIPRSNTEIYFSFLLLSKRESNELLSKAFDLLPILRLPKILLK